MACHNSQVKDFQKIKLETVTVEDSNNYLACSSIEFLSAWDVLNSRLIDAHGGYLQIREVGGKNFLDYVEDFTSNWKKSGNKLVCTQKIEFGKNLVDLSQNIDASNIKTGIIPLGARLKDKDGNDMDKYLTIAALPDKTLFDGIVKTGD